MNSCDASRWAVQLKHTSTTNSRDRWVESFVGVWKSGAILDAHISQRLVVEDRIIGVSYNSILVSNQLAEVPENSAGPKEEGMRTGERKIIASYAGTNWTGVTSLPGCHFKPVRDYCVEWIEKWVYDVRVRPIDIFFG